MTTINTPPASFIAILYAKQQQIPSNPSHLLSHGKFKASINQKRQQTVLPQSSLLPTKQQRQLIQNHLLPLTKYTPGSANLKHFLRSTHENISKISLSPYFLPISIAVVLGPSVTADWFASLSSFPSSAQYP